jgi:hypothetical protein
VQVILRAVVGELAPVAGAAQGAGDTHDSTNILKFLWKCSKALKASECRKVKSVIVKFRNPHIT